MNKRYKLMLVADDHELLESWIISTDRHTPDEDVDVTYPVPNYSALMVSDEINHAIRRHMGRQQMESDPKFGGYVKLQLETE